MRLALLCLLPALAAAAPEPTFVLEFDDGFTATTPAGPLAAQPEGQPELTAGQFGPCLKSGPGTGYLQFATKGVVSPVAGTVEMWVCPVDWQGTEEFFHAFFDVKGEGALYLYKYYQGGLLMLSCDDTKGPYRSASAPIAAWQPGTWHHLAGTWSATQQVVYVDGKRIAATTPLLPKSLGETFTLGDHPWHIPRTTSSLIDRVRIYDRQLSDEHLAAHFAGDYAKTIELSDRSCRLSYTVDAAARRVGAQVVTVADATAGATVALQLRDGDRVLREAPSTSLASGSASFTLDLGDTAPGDYQLVAPLRQAGREVVTLRQRFVVPSTAWRGNALGRADQVLPPWTPLRSASADNQVTVDCWNRRYAIGRDGLPAAISSAGRELLAGPVRLVAGGPATAAGVTLGAASATRAEVTGGGASGRLRYTVRTVAEYDGLLDLTIRLEPGGTPPETLRLDLPVRPEVALYRHRWAPAWAGLTGALPAGDGVVDRAPFIPSAWLGDHDRGLFWFCETAQQWPNHLAENAFETVREGDAVVLRLNLLAPGQQPPADWTFRCGLQATPVRPLPRDWRKWRMTPAPRANIQILWPTPTADSQTYYGYPEAKDPTLFGKRVEDYQAKGVRVIPYSCLSFFSGAAPEWPWFEREWQTGSGDAGSSDVAAYGAVFEMINPTSASYSDFIVDRNVAFQRQFKLDGFYHDNTHPYAMGQTAAGCGWQDAAGKSYPTYPILAYRDLYRRLYAAVKGERPDAWLMAHMSGKVTAPILGYEDAILDGEHFRGKVQDCYLDLLPLDTFRAEFMGRQWGMMPFFLPEFSAEQAKRVEPTRGLLGLLLIHDVQPWPIWCNLAPVTAMYDALDAFGWVDSDFVGYFDPQPPGRTDLRDVHVSAWRRADGRALVVVANVGREPRAGLVTLDPTALGLPLDQVVEWPGKQPAAREGASLRVDLEGLDYRFYLVGREP